MPVFTAYGTDRKLKKKTHIEKKNVLITLEHRLKIKKFS